MGSHCDDKISGRIIIIIIQLQAGVAEKLPWNSRPRNSVRVDRIPREPADHTLTGAAYFSAV